MFMTLPDLTWVASWPPPHCWKMSGGLSDCRASGILVVNCSFWIGTTLNVTFGMGGVVGTGHFCQTPLSGLAVALFHHVSVTALPELEALPEPAPLLLLPHAARVSAVLAATASTAPFRMLRIVVISLRGLGASADQRGHLGLPPSFARRIVHVNRCR